MSNVFGSFGPFQEGEISSQTCGLGNLHFGKSRKTDESVFGIADSEQGGPSLRIFHRFPFNAYRLVLKRMSVQERAAIFKSTRSET